MNGASKKIRRFLEFSSAEKWLFLQAWISLPLVEYRLRTGGLKAYRNVLTRQNADRINQHNFKNFSDFEQIRRKGFIINLAARHSITNVRCLARTLFLHTRLLDQDIDSTIVIGMQNPGSDFNAHAWLEVNGSVVNDSEEAITDFIRVELTESQIKKMMAEKTEA